MDLNLLIDQKLELYPDKRIKILDAWAEMKDGKLNVTVMSEEIK